MVKINHPEIALEALHEYYTENPPEDLEFSTRELVVILIGVAIGSTIGWIAEERSIKKRLTTLERERGIYK